MSDREPTYWLTPAIALAFAVVAVFGIVAYQNTGAVLQSETLVTHSYAVREATRELLSSIKDMETAQRGFLITGDSSYLEPYQAGVNDVEKEFTRLGSLTRDNPIQQRHLNKLRQLYNDKQVLLVETIRLRREEPGPALSDETFQIVISGRGNKVMAELRVVEREILEEENRLLVEREAASEARAVTSERFIIAGNLLALALLVLSGVAAHVDRAKRDNAETQMRSSQAELAAVFSSTNDGIVTFNEDLRIRLMNPAAAEMVTCDRESAIGRPLVDFVPQRLREIVADDIRDFVKSGEPTRAWPGGRALRGDESEFPCKGSLTKSVAGTDHFVTLTFRDLSESQASKAKIREQSQILAQVHDAILVCDMEDRIISWNRGSELLYGLSEEQVIGQNAAARLFADHLDMWQDGRRMMFEKGVYVTEISLVSASGRNIVVEHRRSLIHGDDGQPVAQLIVTFDVTARKRQEAKERRSQRLESIGALAGGIAHDLNNLLTPILMSAKLMKRGGNDNSRLLDTIVLSTERGSQMIKNLLAFAGGKQKTEETIDVRALILEAEDILSHTLPKTIDLQIHCADSLHAVRGDATELSQVLVNLAINARDAMPDGGRLELRAETLYVDASRAEASDILQAGPHVLLTISDTGNGIPRDIIERIFDPFFTTKEQGKGTGLGLATTLGIVRAHGGDITVYSEPDQGTRFAIYLPSVALDEVSSIRANGNESPRGNNEMILLVDDEPLILETARTTLEAGGYRVTCASSGAGAVAMYQQRSSDSIDLVVLDMMMPGMDGFATKNSLQAINPRIRILASSGLRRPGKEGGRLADVDGFLAKPYSDDQLLRAVRSALDKPRTPNREPD